MVANGWLATTGEIDEIASANLLGPSSGNAAQQTEANRVR